MKRLLILAVGFSFVILAVACGEQPHELDVAAAEGPPPDAPIPPDAGPPPDAGSPPDAPVPPGAGPPDDIGPPFSDSEQIAFTSTRDDGNLEIYVMNADGTGQTNLTNNPSSDFGARWKP
jgi:hypothetical protein